MIKTKALITMLIIFLAALILSCQRISYPSQCHPDPPYSNNLLIIQLNPAEVNLSLSADTEKLARFFNDSSKDYYGVSDIRITWSNSVTAQIFITVYYNPDVSENVKLQTIGQIKKELSSEGFISNIWFDTYDCLTAKTDGIQRTPYGMNENITNFSGKSDQPSINISLEGSSFISGKVLSYPNVTVKVQAIQNSSWVAETTADADGNYNLTGLKPGKFGLLFLSNRSSYHPLAYVYNDKINEDLSQNLKETLSHNSTDINIDLTKERPDFDPYRIFVQFKINVSLRDAEKILRSYNCSVDHIYSDTLRVIIPNHKTALEMINKFKADENVETAYVNGISFNAG